jgi:hypothetical protein
MNGAAALFAQSRDLSSLAAATSVSPPSSPMRRTMGPDPEAFLRGAVALHQVACVQKALTTLAEQCAKLPQDHMAREIGEQMIQFLRDVIANAEVIPEEKPSDGR